GYIVYRCYDVTIGDTNFHKLSLLLAGYDAGVGRDFNQDSFSELRIYFDDTDATGTLLFSDASGAPGSKYGNKLSVGVQTVNRQDGNWIDTQEIYVKASTATGRIHVEAVGR